MFETYDTTQRAYVEHSGEYYDLQEQAWVDVPSAMTYDTEEKAWVEGLYAGWFTPNTRNSGYYWLIQNEDTLIINNNGFVFNSLTTNKARRVSFVLPFTFVKGTVIELDIVLNTLGKITFSKNGTTKQTSIAGKTFFSLSGERTEHITVTEQENGIYGYDCIDYWYEIGFQLPASAITGEVYVEVKNFKINGKKYGFTE